MTEKDNIKKEEKKDTINNEELDEEPREFPENEIIGPNSDIKLKRCKKNNLDKNNVYQEFDFKKHLRKGKSFDNKNNKKKKKSGYNSVKKEKPFISTTSIYGNYFDPPLQKGGISKLDDYKK